MDQWCATARGSVGAFEFQQNTSARRQTVGQIPEDYQQVTESPFVNVRGTTQLAQGHTAWVKYYRSPTNGLIIDYWTNRAGNLAALTAQNQSASNWAAQWSGVIRNNWSMEAAFADYSSRIDVTTFEDGALNNAPIYSLAENKYYNGATFDGFVNRPRQQFNTSSNWFLTPDGRTHEVKVGFDFQNLESGSLFQYPNAQLYNAESYNQAAGTFVPQTRQDYQTGDSTSKGHIYTIYARDKFQVTNRLLIEAGFRWERQTGTSDIGVDTLATNVMAPRVSGSFDLTGNGKSLVIGTYGRYYAGIIQGFSDAFANVPQQQNYDVYNWNGREYVFSTSVRVGASAFQPNVDLRPYHSDEFTVGFQRQFGRVMGTSVRFISRNWGNLIDDIRTYRPDNSIARTVANYLDTNCRTTLDASLGVGGVIPCREVQEGLNKTCRPIYDRPHNFKMGGSYVRPVGPIDLTVGAVTDAISKRRYEKQRPVNVLLPGTLTNAGPTATYFYNERGEDQLEGLEWVFDFALEATWRVASTYRAGFKAEAFNLFNNEEKIISNNVAPPPRTRRAPQPCRTSARRAHGGRSSSRTGTDSR